MTLVVLTGKVTAGSNVISAGASPHPFPSKDEIKLDQNSACALMANGTPKVFACRGDVKKARPKVISIHGSGTSETKGGNTAKSSKTGSKVTLEFRKTTTKTSTRPDKRLCFKATVDVSQNP